MADRHFKLALQMKTIFLHTWRLKIGEYYKYISLYFSLVFDEYVEGGLSQDVCRRLCCW